MQEKTLPNVIAEAVETALLAADKAGVYKTAAFSLVLEYLLKKGPAASIAATEPQQPITGASAGMQLNEFLALKSPNTHPDRLTTIAYYYHHEQSEPLTIRDITEAYSRARLKKPQNISDVIATCVRRGHLIDTEKKDGLKAWIITQAGDDAVEEGF